MAWPRQGTAGFQPNAYYPPHPTNPHANNPYPQWYVNQPPKPRDIVVGRAPRYPELNPVLEFRQTTLRIDMRRNPRTSPLCAEAYHHHATINAMVQSATNSASRIRLMSPAFPWQIEINTGQHHHPLTCSIIWDAIYDCFQQKLADSEWGMICSDKKKREAIEKAAKKRCEAGDDEPAIKRIDFLGDAVFFAGLDRNDDFVKLRGLPGSELWQESWMVNMHS